MKSREELRDLMACVDAEVGRRVKSGIGIAAKMDIRVAISLVSIIQIGCRSVEGVDLRAVRYAKEMVANVRQSCDDCPAIQELIDEGWSQPVDVWDDYTGN